ncbi:MAG TPA: AAA family ATPase [Thermoanaerobaculia bacterium]|jgi:predicted ATPase|nr:AAA family ATPase [Thermoanaerobaculia bacterium]
MPQLLGLRIQNYKSLADVGLGQTGYGQGSPLPALSCFIGPNGSGKSSLLGAFGFLADCLREGVEAACDKPQRGGFSKLRTQGRGGAIRFDLYYRESPQARPITYSFAVDEVEGLPVVVEESLLQRRKGQKYGRPHPFLRLKNGAGHVWAGDFTEAEEGATSLDIELDDTGRLGITTLGQLKEHPRIVGLRSYIESWYLSYFIPDAARGLPPAGAQKHLDRTGENLGNVVQYIERTHPDRFERTLLEIARKIPGIRSITHEKSQDGRLLLRFNEQGYGDPFYQQSMSDGTLKMFAYLLLLEDPEPPSFIGIEEPENGLYHKLLEELARELVRHAESSLGKTQILLTTHSPYFVDALKPEQVWLMGKDEQGHTQITRTADMPIIVEMVKEEIPLGSLWYSNHFEERFGN